LITIFGALADLSDNPAIKPDPVSIGIADQNPLIRRGLRSLIADDDRLCLAFSASDGQRFMDAVGRIEFDVGIVGWMMEPGDGEFILNALREHPAAPKIIVYTGYPDKDTPARSMKLGAAGFVSKTEPPEHLLSAVREVAAGRMIFPFFDTRGESSNPLTTLTQRETQMLNGLAAGSTNIELAKQFEVSPNTVKFHLRNLYDKLSVRNRAQAVGLLLERSNTH